MSKTVLIVDDHPVVCEAIRKTLEAQGYSIVGETADGISALSMIVSLKPGIVILDVSLEKMDGLTVLKRVTQANLDVRVLVFTAQSVDTYAMRCLQAGASGFVSKNEPLTKLLKAVDTIVDGYVFFPKKSMPFTDGGRGKNNRDALAALTNRELEVLKLLAEGMTNLEIAEKLHLSNKTVSGHKINILSKLGVTSVVDLVHIARQNELV